MYQCMYAHVRWSWKEAKGLKGAAPRFAGPLQRDCRNGLLHKHKCCMDKTTSFIKKLTWFMFKSMLPR